MTQKFVDRKYQEHVDNNDLAGWNVEYMLRPKSYLEDRPFGEEINTIYDQNRIGHFRPHAGLAVDTFWDLGVRGTTVWLRYETARGFFKCF